MTTLVKIDGEPVELAEWVRVLKLSGQFNPLLEKFVLDRVTARAARKAGIQVSEAEIQERANEFRRARGLHRASDTNKFLDEMHISLEEFERFITDTLYQEKLLQQVCSDQAVKEYFKLNSPKFDSVELAHMVVDSDAKAREMMAVLEDDPDSFDDMAREHSTDDSRARGGLLGKVLRGSLRADVEAKVFAAAAGDILGPFGRADRKTWEILQVLAKHPARLDDASAADVRRLLREDWLRARLREHQIESQ